MGMCNYLIIIMMPELGVFQRIHAVLCDFMIFLINAVVMAQIKIKDAQRFWASNTGAVI